MSRPVTSVLVSSFLGTALAVAIAGWIYPCLGAARWERCATGLESDPSAFALPICHLGVCDTYLSWFEVLSRVAVVSALALTTAAAAWYFSRSSRALSAGVAVTLATVMLAAVLPYAYPHG
jgi:hypothetical protein